MVCNNVDIIYLAAKVLKIERKTKYITAFMVFSVMQPIAMTRGNVIAVDPKKFFNPNFANENVFHENY